MNNPPKKQPAQYAPTEQERNLGLVDTLTAKFQKMGYDQQTSGKMALAQLFPNASKASAPAGENPKVQQIQALHDYYVSIGKTEDEANALADPTGYKAVHGAAGGATGQGGVWQIKHDAYLRSHPGDEQGALQYASGQRMVTSTEARHMAALQALDENRQQILPDGVTYQQRIDQLVPLYMNNNPNAAGPDTPAPGPTTPLSQAAPAAPGQSVVAANSPIAQAKAAIAAGADPVAVKKRLAENGIDPTGL